MTGLFVIFSFFKSFFWGKETAIGVGDVYRVDDWVLHKTKWCLSIFTTNCLSLDLQY